MEQGVNLLVNSPHPLPFFSHYGNMRTKTISINNFSSERIDSKGWFSLAAESQS